MTLTPQVAQVASSIDPLGESPAIRYQYATVLEPHVMYILVQDDPYILLVVFYSQCLVAHTRSSRNTAMRASFDQKLMPECIRIIVLSPDVGVAGQ